MRLAQLRHDGQDRVALVEHDAFRLLPPKTEPLALMEMEPPARERIAAATPDSESVPFEHVDLRPPLIPTSIRDFVCFTQHIEGMMLSVGDGELPDARLLEPTFYFSNPHAVIGAHDEVAIPPDCRQFDYELEVAAVIGKAGRDLSPESTRSHIIAYTIFNDWTARDVAQTARQASRHAIKAKDSAITLGPWLVSADELEPYRGPGGLDLEMSVWLNDRRMGSDRLSSMGWSFDEIVSYASRGAWIGRGDILASGTCGGGCLAELWGRAGSIDPPPLQPGDIVTMTVEGIGTIANRVIAAEGEPPPVLPVRGLRRLDGPTAADTGRRKAP